MSRRGPQFPSRRLLAMTAPLPLPADPPVIEDVPAVDEAFADGTPTARADAKRRVARNSMANLVRTITTFVLGFIVPPALIRWVPDDQYKAYTLSFRVGAFVALLDLGMQLATTRRFGEALASGDEADVRAVAVAANRIFSIICSVGAAAVLAVAIRLHDIFPDIAAANLPAARAALLIVSFAGLASLQLSPYNALVTASQKTPSVLVATVVARVAAGVLLLLAAWLRLGIVTLASISAIASVGVSLVSVRVIRHQLPWFRPKRAEFRRNLARTLWHQSLVFAILSVGELMINSLDVAVVGRFDYDMVIVFSVSTTLVIALESFHAAMLLPVLPDLTRTLLVTDRHDFDRDVDRYTRVAVAARTSSMLAVILGAPFLLRIWVGDAIAGPAVPIVRALVIADAIRFTDRIYGIAVIASGAFRKLISKPLLEGLCHVTLMLSLAGRYGANGVAAANIASACFGVVWLALVCMPRTFVDVGIHRGRYYLLALLKPALVSAPFIAADIVFPNSGFTALVVRGALVLASTAICFRLFLGTTLADVVTVGRKVLERLQRSRPGADDVRAGRPTTGRSLIVVGYRAGHLRSSKPRVPADDHDEEPNSHP